MARQPKPWYRADRKVWCVTINGHRHNLGRTKKEALERFYGLMRQPHREKVVAVSVASVIDPFLGWTQRNRSEVTYEWYRQRLQRFVDRYPDLQIDQLRPFHVETWASEVKRSINTRRNLMRSVKRCLKWAHAQGYIDRNPILALEIPSAMPKEVFVTRTEFDTLLTHVRNEEFAQLLKVTYEIGCRPQESLRVEARHVDLDRHRWVFPTSESKGKSAPRVVYLTKQAADVTAALVAQYSAGPLFRNTSGTAWTPYSIGCSFARIQFRIGKAEMRRQGMSVSNREVAKLIPSLRKTRMSHGESVPKSVAELKEEARRKLTEQRARELAPRYSLYALRHSWATNALQSGIDALTVAILMGHKDPSTLARTYQHLSHNPEHLLAQARRVST